MVGSRVIYPAAAFLEMNLAATHLKASGSSNVINSLFELGESVTLNNFQIHAPLEMRENGSIQLQVVVTPADTDGKQQIKVYSHSSSELEEQRWILHTSSSQGQPSLQRKDLPKWSPERIREMQKGTAVPSSQFYEELRLVGLNFGKHFQSIKQFWFPSDTETLAEVEILKDQEKYTIHPILIDAVIQAGLARGVHSAVDLMLPVKIGCVVVMPRKGLPEISSEDALLVHTWQESSHYSGYLLTKDFCPLVYLEDVRMVNTTRMNFESVLDEQVKHSADMWEEVWRRVENRPNIAELPLVTSYPENTFMGGVAGPERGRSHDIMSWVAFIPKQVHKFRQLLDALSRSAPVTAIFSSVETMNIFRSSSPIGVNCLVAGEPHFPGVGKILDDVPHPYGIVFAWGIDSTRGDPLNLALPFLEIAKYICQSGRPPMLYVVTEGVFPVTKGTPVSNPKAAVLCGMAKSLKSENQNLFVRCIDLEHCVLSSKDTEGLTSYTNNLLKELALSQQTGDSSRFQVAYRENVCFEPKLVKSALFSKQNQVTFPSGDQDYQLLLPSSKKVSDLKFAPLRPDWDPREEKINVRIHSYGLNFKDLLTVTKPSLECESFHTVGMDLAGIITQVGTQATAEIKLKVGDRVFGLNFQRDHLPSSVLVRSEYLRQVPPNLTLEQVSTLPLAFSTAYHCLVSVARMTKGDTVLLHTASGGVGLAAIQLCHHFGAKVIATAGSDLKRFYLKSLGGAHVFNSRNLTFARNVEEVTNGKGVDIVLNSLTSSGFKEATLGICAAHARFVEMSKMSIWTPEEVQQQRPDVEYTVVDMPELNIQTHSYLLSQLKSYLEKGIIKPITYTKYNAAYLRNALAHFQEGGHIGKIICSMPHPADLQGGERSTSLFSANSTYLITGGMGGIGFEVCKWMLDRGATDIVLMGRRPPRPEVAASIDALKGKGHRLEIFLGDVGNVADCKILFDKILHSGRPLRGIMHSAGSLVDNSYAGQTEESFRTTFSPKVDGTWHLHNLSKHMPLEHFVLFSSVSALLGTYAQPNYAAANSFMDSFAHYRRSLGLPATTINWGQWAQIGMAKDTKIPGVRPVSIKRMLKSFENIFKIPQTQTALVDFTSLEELTVVSGIAKGYVDAGFGLENRQRQFRPVTSNGSLSKEKFWDDLHRAEKASELEEAVSVIVEVVTSLIRDGIGVDSTEALSSTVAIAQFGVDSLVVLELRNKMQLLVGSEHQIIPDVITTGKSIKNISEDIYRKIFGNKASDNCNEERVANEEKIEIFRKLLETDCILPESVSSPMFNEALCRPSEICTVLVTGVTGFLGSHVLSALCTKKYESIKSIVCLTRASNKIQDPKQLLVNTQWSAENCHYSNKITCLEGDFTSPNLGITPEIYEQLARDVDAVIHIAAKTNHIEPYIEVPPDASVKSDVRTVNVTGTLNILKFAAAIKTKHVYLASSFWSAGIFDENEGTLSGRWPPLEIINWVVDNDMPGYYCSKFVCEVLLKQAIDRGIPCKAFRFPPITGNSTTWEVNYENNHLIHRFITNLQVKAVSNLPMPLNHLPVDACAEVSLEVFFNDDAPPEIYFVVHPRPQLEESFQEIAKTEFGVDLDIVDATEFARRLQAMSTPLTLISDMYTNTGRMKNIFSVVGLREYVKSSKLDVTASVKRYVPTFGTKLESPLEYIRRDLRYAQSNGFFPEILK